MMKSVTMSDGGVFTTTKIEVSGINYSDVTSPMGQTKDEFILSESQLYEDDLDVIKKKRKIQALTNGRQDYSLMGAGCEFRLTYRPPNINGVTKVALVQITKPMLKVREQGLQSFAARRGEARMIENCWYFDRQGGQRHPVFGMDMPVMTGPTVIAHGVQLTDNRGVYGTQNAVASMIDMPKRVSAQPFEHRFQTAALVVEGDDNKVGKYLGIVEWAYGHDGKNTLLEDISTVRESSFKVDKKSSGFLDNQEFGGLTHVFRECILLWNKEDNNSNVPLPLD